jgi:hypothetical protein
MVFIGVRTWGSGEKKSKIMNINTKYIKIINETDMELVLDDNTTYRIDDESIEIFLSAIYGEASE